MKKDIIAILTVVGVYMVLFGAVCMMWVGAEYMIDKVVTFGRVDGIVAMYVAWTAMVNMGKIGSRLKVKNHDKSVQV